MNEDNKNDNENVTNFKNDSIDYGSIIANELNSEEDTNNKNENNKEIREESIISKIYQENINNRNKILQEDEKHNATESYDFDLENKNRLDCLINQTREKQIKKMKKMQKYFFITSLIGIGLILLVLLLEIYWIFIFQ